MGEHYQHMTASERAIIMVRQIEGASVRAIAGELARSPSTISRELARNGGDLNNNDSSTRYDSVLAQARARRLAHAPSVTTKLGSQSALFNVVCDQLREGWSPEQVSGILRRAFPDDPSRSVVHETIYTAIYVMPRGELRRELIASLRRSNGKRRKRSQGLDRRGKIADMAPLAMRPPEAEDRVIPGHWEGDLIKGAFNRSCVGTLVERTSRMVQLVRMDDSSADAALIGFTRALSGVDPSMRKTLTYDQGKEMARHKELTAATGVAVYFADPHSPWQRGSNENTNGLLRQYLPKGVDLSTFSQADLDAIALKLNTRPRKVHGFRTPCQVFGAHLHDAKARISIEQLNNSV